MSLQIISDAVWNNRLNDDYLCYDIYEDSRIANSSDE
jgi:hypothetical protein